MAGFESIAAAYVELRPKLAESFEAEAGASLSGAVGRITSDAALVFASKKLFDIAKSGLAEFNQAAKVDAQTEVAIRGLGEGASISAKDVEDLGTQMRDLAGFNQEAGKSAANILLRFGAIHDTGTLKRVETDAADLAVAMGTDLPNAAQTLGVVLQNPENAARRLRPIIGSLTDAQKESIAAFTAQGDAAGAQNVILQILEQRLGGAAKAYGDTLPGEIDKANASIDESKKELVGGLAPALGLGAKGVSFLSEQFQKQPAIAKEVEGGLVLIGGGIGALLRPAADLAKVYDSLSGRRAATAASSTAEAAGESEVAAARAVNVGVTESLSAAEQNVVAARTAGTVSTTALTVSTEALTAAETEAAVSAGALDLALGPIGLVAAAAAVGIAAFTLTSGDGAQATKDYTEALKSNKDELDQNIDKVTASKLASEGSAKAASAAGLSFGTMGKAIRDGVDDFGGYHRAALGGTADNDTLRSGLIAAGAESTEYGKKLLALVDAHKLNSGQVRDLSADMEGLHNGYTDAASTASDLKAAQDGLGGTLSNTSGADAQKAHLDSLKTSASSAQTALDSLVQAQRGLLSADIRVAGGPDSIANANARVEAARAKLGTGSTQAENDQLQRDFNQTVRDAASATNDYASAVAEQADQQAKAHGTTLSSNDLLGIYSNKLHELAASTTDGDIHNGLQFLITDLDNTTAAAWNASAAVQSIVDKQDAVASAEVGISGIAAAAQLAQDIKNSQDFAAAVAYGESQKSSGRAYGGPVGPGFSGPVGELGEEWLSINTDGTGWVTPNSQTGTPQRSQGAGDVTILQVYGDPTPDAIARWAQEANRQSFLASGHTKRALTLSRR